MEKSDNIINLKHLGKRITVYRQKAGYSMKQLGDLVGLSKTTIAEMERGLHAPVFSSFVNICNALNVSPDALLQSKDKQSFVHANEIYARAAHVELGDQYINTILELNK